MRWTEDQFNSYIAKNKKAAESEQPLTKSSENPNAFVLPLNPVTKKNHNNLVHYGAECPLCKKRQYTKVKPSTAYQKYEEAVEPYMCLLKSKVGFINYPINLKCLFYCKTRSKSDLVGYLQSIQDILVKYGVLEDDNHNIVVSMDGSRVLYDKNNPRTEIVIEKLENNH